VQRVTREKGKRGKKENGDERGLIRQRLQITRERALVRKEKEKKESCGNEKGRRRKKRRKHFWVEVGGT